MCNKHVSAKPPAALKSNWNNSTKKLTITNQTLPPVDPNGNTCTIHDAEITIPNLNLS